MQDRQRRTTCEILRFAGIWILEQAEGTSRLPSCSQTRTKKYCCREEPKFDWWAIAVTGVLDGELDELAVLVDQVLQLLLICQLISVLLEVQGDARATLQLLS